jgi:hypothetical protein
MFRTFRRLSGKNDFAHNKKFAHSFDRHFGRTVNVFGNVTLNFVIISTTYGRSLIKKKKIGYIKGKIRNKKGKK